jgi:hypothetical protein
MMMMYLSAHSQSAFLLSRRQPRHTQLELDDAQNASNAGHSLCPQQRAIVQTQVAGRSLHHQRWRIWRGRRGKRIVGGGRMQVDVPEREKRERHGASESGKSQDGFATELSAHGLRWSIRIRTGRKRECC